MNYRITGSCIPADPKFDDVRAAFRSLGIADYVNVIPHRARKRNIQMFMMIDGSLRPSDSTILCRVAQLAGKRYEVVRSEQ